MKINRPNKSQIIVTNSAINQIWRRKTTRFGMNYTIRLYQFNSRAMNHNNVIIPTILFRKFFMFQFSMLNNLTYQIVDQFSAKKLWHLDFVNISNCELSWNILCMQNWTLELNWVSGWCSHKNRFKISNVQFSTIHQSEWNIQRPFKFKFRFLIRKILKKGKKSPKILFLFYSIGKILLMKLEMKEN